MPQAEFNRISVIGLGYIGLPTAAIFALHGVEVVGVDVNQIAVDTINSGRVHIIEPDLDEVVQKVVKDGYLRAATIPEPAEAFLIAVPTPFRGENHEPDLSYVKAAAIAIAPMLAKGNLVILESTSPVGATEALAGWLSDERPDLSFPQTAGEASDIRVAHCPERVLPGRVMQELITNDRVIGGLTRACAEQAVSLYKTFVTGDCLIATGARTAEMAKLAENSFRDVNIAYANELSVICEQLEIDVWELVALANRHPRVNILQPGPGVGGHCIAVDPWFIVASAPENAKLIKTAREVNDAKPDWVVRRVMQVISDWKLAQVNGGRKPRISLYGLAFKPNIDDLRESPAVEIMQSLLAANDCEIFAVEPNLETDRLGRVELIDLEVSLQTSDIHVLLVDHDEFRRVTPKLEYLVDTRGIWGESR